MNQLTVVQPQTAAVAVQTDFSIRDMERMAVAFAQSGLFGVKTPDQALALCLLAHAEGRHPALAARDYDIINLRPAKKADAMQRDFLGAGGKIEWHALEDDICDATFSHPLGGSARITWDMKRAQTAGLGGKDMWKKYPRQMLRSRVVSEGVRTVYPSAAGGMYVPEEVRDFDQDRPEPSQPPAKRARDIKAEPVSDKARGKAEEWVAEHVAAVADAATPEDLEALRSGGARAVTKLSRDHADLHAAVLAAYDSRIAELTPPADWNEAPGDEDQF